MLKAYRDHVAERAALGIPPLPLSAQQTGELIELLKNPPKGEDATLVELITKEGALVQIADINEARLQEVGAKYGAKVYTGSDLYSVDVDIYAPCALGATINDQSIEQFKCKIIAGCANNQLKEARHGEVLRQKGILYAPDYVINAGGIINVYSEMSPQGYDEAWSTGKVMEIYNTLLNIFQRADAAAQRGLRYVQHVSGAAE